MIRKYVYIYPVIKTPLSAYDALAKFTHQRSEGNANPHWSFPSSMISYVPYYGQRYGHKIDIDISQNGFTRIEGVRPRIFVLSEC